MSFNETAIKVQSLGKCYHIYNQPQDRLKQFVYPRLQNLLHAPLKTYFHEFWALQNVNFEVKKGETVGIIGRNGSGKSTLLQLICGTLTPTSGTVETSGRVAALLELGSGFNPEFTGRENVYLNGAVLGLTTDEINQRFDAIAAFADIGEFIEQPVKTYSSGMVVRLAFAVQASIDPDILIVDEALAVGDEKFQRKCFARLEKLKSRGTAILFVSHSGSQIIELCDRALLLEHGARLMYSQPMAVVRAYHKIIYAPPDRYVVFVQEFRDADQPGDTPVNQVNKLPIEDPVDQTNPEMAVTSTDLAQPGSDYFDPGLTPETTVIYPVQGAEIRSFRILDLDGRQVNVLVPGNEYRIEISGKFLTDREGIYFGVHIRSISGTVITGQNHPEEGKFISQVQSGKTFHVSFGFKMNLLPGVYFVGGGVWSCYEPNCLHRIMDALMFRAQQKGAQNSFGVCDLMTIPVEIEIS